MEGVYKAVVALVVLLCLLICSMCLYEYIVSSARVPDDAPVDPD